MPIKWYHVTRAIGAITALYELLIDTGAPDRATIILAAFGIMGLDWVSRQKANGNGK